MGLRGPLMAMLAACTAMALPEAAAALPSGCSRGGVTVTCTYTTGESPFAVPQGVTTIHVVAVGASTAPSSRGARVSADLSVTPGDALLAVVGGAPNGTVGGANGGGDGATSHGADQAWSDWACPSGGGAEGGGGASDVRSGADLSSRLIVAAGAGGAGCAAAGPPTDKLGAGGLGGNAGGDGGDGGGGAFSKGGGGYTPIQASGGAGGVATGAGYSAHGGSSGSLGAGGAGGSSAYALACCDQAGPGGGGGGGYYGGGGGAGGTLDPTGATNDWGGGGGGAGGSNLVPPGGSIALDTAGTPEVVISYDDTVSLGSPTPHAGVVGQRYSFNYTAASSVVADTITYAGQALPPGLTLSADGLLSGTPTAAGTFVLTVTATSSSGASATRHDSVVVDPAAGGGPPQSPPPPVTVTSTTVTPTDAVTFVLVPTTDGTATVTLSAPTASVAVHGCRHGQVRISGRCRPSTTVLGTATASGTAGQQLLLTVKPTARLKAALKRHKRLRLIATLTYRPSNGGPATVTKRTITMTAG